MKKSSDMAYRSYFFRMIALQLILAFTLLAFAYTLLHGRMVITCLNLAVLSILELVYLVRFLNRTNRELERFFDSVHFGDGTFSFGKAPKTGKYASLRQTMEKLLDEFRQVRLTLEEEKLFYQYILHHIGIGLLVTDAKGSIRFSNQTVQRMLDNPKPMHPEQFEKLKPGLGQTLLNLQPGNRELIKVVIRNEVVQLSVHCSQCRVEEETYRILTFQDIKQEIEINEAEAWQKLIRILTHEIMNSISPVTLTSSALLNMIEKNGKPVDPATLDRVSLDQITTGLQAIRKRSKGLAAFVENYQSIHALPQPLMTRVEVKALFTHTEMIMQEELQRQSVCFETTVAPPSLVMHADERLITQVLINLIRNAIQALAKQTDKKIHLAGFAVHDQVRISLSDNGMGIPPELLDTVFVPFFTTRKEGSGIGLSLSREIMKLHGGGIRVSSEPGKGTVFTLVF